MVNHYDKMRYWKNILELDYVNSGGKSLRNVGFLLLFSWLINTFSHYFINAM